MKQAKLKACEWKKRKPYEHCEYCDGLEERCAYYYKRNRRVNATGDLPETDKEVKG